MGKQWDYCFPPLSSISAERVECGEKVGLWLAAHSAGKVNCANWLGSNQVLIQTPAAASRALAIRAEEEPSTDLVITVCFLGGS